MVALVVVVVLLEAAERLGDVAGDGRFLRNDQGLAHAMDTYTLAVTGANSVQVARKLAQRRAEVKMESQAQEIPCENRGDGGTSRPAVRPSSVNTEATECTTGAVFIERMRFIRLILFWALLAGGADRRAVRRG